MYATVRRYENTENTGATIANATERFVPMLRAHAGFISYDIVDAGNGVLITLSVFETEADARASDAEALKFNAEYQTSNIHGTPQITEGPVVLHR